jgi:hypothetical protein
MTDESKHENHGGYEHQDLRATGILYFLLALGVATILSLLLLRGVYEFLDRRERASQPAVNPLVSNVPTDTRHIAPGYPQSAFPDPKLEENERGQLNGFRHQQEEMLYSYGWVDEQAGTVRIPIERAMDLIVQRGLPVRPQGAGYEAAMSSGATSPEGSKKVSQTGTAGQGEKQ